MDKRQDDFVSRSRRLAQVQEEEEEEEGVAGARDDRYPKLVLQSRALRWDESSAINFSIRHELPVT